MVSLFVDKLAISILGMKYINSFSKEHGVSFISVVDSEVGVMDDETDIAEKLVDNLKHDYQFFKDSSKILVLTMSPLVTFTISNFLKIEDFSWVNVHFLYQRLTS